MWKRLTESVIDANNCERNIMNESMWYGKQQKLTNRWKYTNRQRGTVTTQKRHPN